jgi:hypothetical protein
MSERIKVIFSMLIVLLAIGKLLAQGGGTIRGTVTDEAGAIIVGATVKALDLASNRELTTTTDEKGQYLFKGLRAGSYSISVASRGFVGISRNVLVSEAGEQTEDFVLSPGVIQDTVTVTAAKGNIRVASEVPQTVSVTTSDDIERR